MHVVYDLDADKTETVTDGIEQETMTVLPNFKKECVFVEIDQ